jgi:hypothetical protein
MNHYTADDIYLLNAYYVQHFCQTENYYAFVIAFLRYSGLVQEYFHYLNTGELSFQLDIDQSFEEYFQDFYDY